MGRQAERAVLAQCERCDAIGTAKASPTGRIVSMNLAARPERTGWFHRGCGGRFAAFDIESDT